MSGSTVTLTFGAPTNPNLGPVSAYALSCLPEDSVAAMSGPSNSTGSEHGMWCGLAPHTLMPALHGANAC